MDENKMGKTSESQTKKKCTLTNIYTLTRWTGKKTVNNRAGQEDTIQQQQKWM